MLKPQTVTVILFGFILRSGSVLPSTFHLRASRYQHLVLLPSYLSCRAEELLPDFPDITFRRERSSPEAARFSTLLHKKNPLIGGSVSVLDERRCNKYLCGGRLAQSADVGVMNGQSVPELMNHCLCRAVDTAGGRTSVEYQIEEPRL